MNFSTCPRCKAGDVFDLEYTEHGLCQKCDVLLADDRTAARRKVANLFDWGMIDADQRDRLMLKIDFPANARTADGKAIIVGNTYWDYDLQQTVVTGIMDVSLDGRERDGAAIWWRTTTGMFDGTRLAHRRAS